MGILNQLKQYSDFLLLVLKDYDELTEEEEMSILDTFPPEFIDKLYLALDFVNNDIIPDDDYDLKILIELLDYLIIDKAKEIYKIVYESPIYDELNEFIKLNIYDYLN